MRLTSIGALGVCAFVALLACVASVAMAGDVYLDKINAVPDYTQTDPAYGGFPDGSGTQHGGYFCGPSSASNGLLWLSDNGFPNLSAHTADHKKDHHDLLATIASNDYIDAYDYDGADPTRMANGLAEYISDCGYETSYFKWQGWRSVPSWVDTYVDVPQFDWMCEGIEGSTAIQLWSVGWYAYNSSTNNYDRVGGHWVSMVGYDFSNDNNPKFVIHDPSPRCDPSPLPSDGNRLRNEYISTTVISSGTIEGSVSAAGQHIISGWPINTSNGATLSILDGVFVIQLVPENYSPVAVNDTYAFTEDNSKTIYPYQGTLVNDTDQEQDPLSAIQFTNPAHGTLQLLASGSLTYTPDPNYHGTDSFTYKAFDGTAYSNMATVTLEVASVNDVPIAGNDTFEVDKGGILNTYSYNGVLANDSDADNDVVLKAILASGPSHGTLALYSSGSFRYTPQANYWGTDSFTYKVYDGTAYSDLATVLIEILASLSGDANNDGVVDQLDAKALAQNWGKTSATWEMGDFDGNGVVNAADASILMANWGSIRETSEATAVPEPSMLVYLFLLATLGTGMASRRKHGK